MDFKKAFEKIKVLANNFGENIEKFKLSTYKEAEVRQDFIDPLFEILGWDVRHVLEKDPYKQDVKIEKSQNQEGEKNKKFADYAFYANNNFKDPVFFVEAKKPSLNLEDNKDFYLQTHKYGWNAGLPICILTDFEEIIILDTRRKPSISNYKLNPISVYQFSDLCDESKFSELYYLFGREAIYGGSIENYVDNHLDKIKETSSSNSTSVGADFLNHLDYLRLELANEFYKENSSLTEYELTEATQKTIDRLVFIRFLEDKGIEIENFIRGISTWKEFIKLSRLFDGKYNGIVFKSSIIDNPKLISISDSKFMRLCQSISSKESPYVFNVIPVHIIGSIYERFLGSEIRIQNDKVYIDTKDDVKKAGGVYYTPKPIVEYIVDKCVGEKIAKKKPEEIEDLSFVDMSCGSGSFLLGVYELIIEYHNKYYQKILKDKSSIDKRNVNYRNAEFKDGKWKTSLYRKQQILLNNIFGTDIDQQAVEVTQFSLFLKLLEDETIDSTSGGALTLVSKVLPDLTDNIKSGNALVDMSVFDFDNIDSDEYFESNPFNFRDGFPSVFSKDSPGFDAVIGNPPYIKEGKNSGVFKYVKESYLSKYYQGKMDLWYFFVSNGLDLLRDNGLLGYIAPNNWTTSAGASKLRNKVIRDSKIIEIFDFENYMVFDTASIQTMIFILEKKQISKPYVFNYYELIDSGRARSVDVLNTLRTKEPEYVEMKFISPKLDPDKYKDNYLVFSSTDKQKVFDHVNTLKAKFLDKSKEMTQGIVPNPDIIGTRNLKRLSNDLVSEHRIEKGDGVFVLSDDEIDKLGISGSTFLKPIHEPYLMDKYSLGPSKSKIIYSTKENSLGESDPIVANHLNRFRSIMDARRENISGRLKYYHLHWPRKEKFFKSGGKIISVRKCAKPTFIYTEDEAYVMMSCNVIITKRFDMKALTGILNSKLAKFWFREKGKMQGSNFQIDTEPLSKFPIVSDSNYFELISDQVQKLIDVKLKLVDAVSDRHKTIIQRHIEDIESKIDVLVFKLYSIPNDLIKYIKK